MINRMAQRRRARGYMLPQMSRETGMTLRQLKRLELGESKNINIRAVRKVCAYYGMGPWEFIQAVWERDLFGD